MIALIRISAIFVIAYFILPFISAHTKQLCSATSKGNCNWTHDSLETPSLMSHLCVFILIASIIAPVEV